MIVLMATVAAFITNLSGKMVKGTTAQFQHEQSVLLAKSYTEYAIMAVTANEHNSTNCLNSITGAYGDSDGDGVPDMYNINVNISYIGNNLDGSCARILNTNPINTPKSPLNIIVDVFVSYTDFDQDDLNITYHRRSLQKI